MSRPHTERPAFETNSLSAIEHILSHRPKRIRILHLSAQENVRLQKIFERAKAAHVLVDRTARGEQAIAELEPFEYTPLDRLMESLSGRKRAVVLGLDHLQDPQNFGALCRTAEALGVAGILIPKDRAVNVTPGVYSASAGAVETIPIVMVSNLGDGLRKLKDQGFWVVGSSLGKEAKPPSEAPSFEKVALVLGTELEGMSSGIEKVCDWQVEIPLKGKIQSLNVSVAGALLMYHFTRLE